MRRRPSPMRSLGRENFEPLASMATSLSRSLNARALLWDGGAHWAHIGLMFESLSDPSRQLGLEARCLRPPLWSSCQLGLRSHYPRAPTPEPSNKERAPTQEPALSIRKVKLPGCPVCALFWLAAQVSFSLVLFSRPGPGFLVFVLGFLVRFVALFWLLVSVLSCFAAWRWSKSLKGKRAPTP